MTKNQLVRELGMNTRTFDRRLLHLNLLPDAIAECGASKPALLFEKSKLPQWRAKLTVNAH